MYQNNDIKSLKQIVSIMLGAIIISTMTPVHAESYSFGPFKLSVPDTSTPVARQNNVSTQQVQNTQPDQLGRQSPITDPGVLATSRPDRTGDWPTSPHCRPLKFNTALDVDTSYSRAMRNFSFRSEGEVRQIEKSTVVYMTDPLYKHVAHQGSFYRMEQLVKFKGQSGEQRVLHMAMVLSKEGNGTAVEANYCTNPRDASEAQVAYHDFVNKKIRDTFN